MYFYELHEGDEEVFSDVLLAHEREFDEAEFLDLVLDARREVLGRFEEDTLVEAIANELEDRHGFLHIDDTRLRVSVDVSAEEGETAVTPADERTPQGEVVGDEHYRSLVIDMDPDDEARGPVH
ncbi:MAG TPA: hypothetical protein VGQ47_00450 [Candidatus Limnocylindrales bacterium]|nr:hypothetical protein [Candidatus Limnocylindrales bacterium]